MSTVTYNSGDVQGFNSVYSQWYDAKETNTLVYSFNEDEFVYTKFEQDGGPTEDIKYEKYIHEELVDDLHLEFVAQYNQDTIISVKYSPTNPTNLEMIRWSDDIVKKHAYYYVVACRVSIKF